MGAEGLSGAGAVCKTLVGGHRDTPAEDDRDTPAGDARDTPTRLPGHVGGAA